MRLLAASAGVLLISSVYGLKVLDIQGPVTAIKPYLFSYVAPTKEFELTSHPRAFGVPMTSKASVGMVVSKTVPDYLSLTMLVIGNDEVSKRWLATQQPFLKTFQGLGLVANVETEAQLSALQKRAGIPLVAANVDALMALIHQTHYPLVIEKGRVWQ
ncbi:integrating conjugative element protein, PFL_4695 family [Legionella beliardensis]|uniref:Integrating conjugative element protein, PFL_4695 family n=1 Tax=Legionella beliardensis TaxID=91822 RepID=A0A378JTC6_9GAMM|nr:integrating conjugative element protein [Legionella beliardensis]STX55456.1 integrating conjugative element protein, PFL_4695 family [Legionella beliardensis]STX55528.1 integrating conjugative element protein, PFL_4695 family [Legionella beliardensis]